MIYDLPHPTVIDIIFRSYLQEALHVSESKLRNIVEHSVDGVVIVDFGGCIVMWNSGQEHITGISAGEALGRLIWEVQYALTPAPRQDMRDQEQLREQFFAITQSTNNDRPPPSIEIEIVRDSGERRIVQQFAFIIPTIDEHRIGFVFRDVTDLRQITKNLLRRNAELNLLNRINRVLASSLDLQQARKTVLKEVVQLLDASGASIWLVNEQCGDLVCVQSLDCAGEAVPEAVVNTWRSAALQTFSQRQTLIIPDVGVGRRTADIRVDERFSETRSLMCVPLEFKNSVHGVLLIIDEEPDCFSKNDASLLESIAAAAAIAFENARLVQKAQQLAILQERQRLAVSLHDAINQSLFSAGLIAEVLPRLIERDPKQASGSVQDLRRLLRGAVADLRDVLTDIQPPLLGEASFDDLLRQLAAGSHRDVRSSLARLGVDGYEHAHLGWCGCHAHDSCATSEHQGAGIDSLPPGRHRPTGAASWRQRLHAKGCFPRGIDACYSCCLCGSVHLFPAGRPIPVAHRARRACLWT